ncbi:SGNH/GDSL hydrolase family protein [Massilia sp. PAMC28688]|uniref:SGNH/GDSL hydrolase family protein n=1 Tax=Massilia sp. PAMC28688 TaxID=2861283 RepID=UPI001C6330F8|nr:SGNH/GDSL hydrolase family protein [Massilia sp. PAMC28688]QYF93858.1 SGNH/GDSL hydrolase family protein [Massilia sp. PAMC28688]
MKLFTQSALARSSGVCLFAFAVVSAGCTSPARLTSEQAPPEQAAQWTGTWGTAPAGPTAPGSIQSFANQTLRLIVHTSIGGSQVRIRVSNEHGAVPLYIGAARIALQRTGAEIVPGSDRALTFSGSRSVTIPAGSPAVSDPIAFDVPASSDLAISLYFPAQVQVTTIHENAFQTNYVSAPGNFAAASVLPTQKAITSWPFLTQVDVLSRAPVLVAFGDSITEGAITTLDANQRWPDLLARRVQSAARAASAAGKALVHPTPAIGIVNRGIGGNRLLRDSGGDGLAGRAALARFDRDVLATAGVEHVIVLLGINDIGVPGTPGSTLEQAVTVDDLVAGYRQLIARARARGLKIYGGTMTPFEGTIYPDYYSPEKERVRQAANAWIRTSGEFDGVIDFDRAVRDPDHPARLLPAFDGGDHLHPGDLGMRAMADAVPLELFAAKRTGSGGVDAVPTLIGTR